MAFCTRLFIYIRTTIECTAPILAHAKTAITDSSIIGIYTATRSPFLTPLLFNTFANLQTSVNKFLYVKRL